MWFWVKSMCWLASRASANMLMPMTMAATAMTPMMENQIRRRIASVRLPLFDDDGVEEQPETDEGGEEDQIAQADHAAGEVLEPVDHRDAPCDLGERRRVARQEIGHNGIGGDGEHEAHRDGEHEGDHLVLGQCRQGRSHREERAGHQQRADIARGNHAVVRPAQDVDGDDERERQEQRDGAEHPGCKEFSQNFLRLGNRQREQQFDSAEPASLGPEPHGDRGDQQQKPPGNERKERVEVGLATIEEAAEVERQRSLQHEEDDNEHGRNGRSEIGGEFAFGDDQNVAHAQAAYIVSCRNTSSSLPDGCRPCSSAGVASATTRPAAMMIAREHTASTSSRICVEITIAFSGAICAISARTSCFWLGSSPSVGSSSTSTGGSCSSACAKPTRRLNPLDSVSTGCSSTPRSRVRSIACSTRLARSRPEYPRPLAQNVRKPVTVISG